MTRRKANEQEAGAARPETAGGTNCVQHVEIVSHEPARLARFLHDVFGWTIRPSALATGETYHVFRTPDGNGGGVMAPLPGQRVGATPYIHVDDLEAARLRCEEAGATILRALTVVPGQGRFFSFRQGDGPVLACWEPANK